MYAPSAEFLDTFEESKAAEQVRHVCVLSVINLVPRLSANLQNDVESLGTRLISDLV